MIEELGFNEDGRDVMDGPRRDEVHEMSACIFLYSIWRGEEGAGRLEAPVQSLGVKSINPTSRRDTYVYLLSGPLTQL